ncbi:MAG: DUF763 domain-containing protein [candidate division WOR-3 bacterium]
MIRTGFTELPLHTGKAPRWLFEKMVLLCGEILTIMVIEYGRNEVLKRFSDPYWFQALGCVSGFDWHSSGLTVTLLGAVKESLKEKSKELGIFVAGGKGKAALKTPTEILEKSDRFGIEAGEKLVRISRLVARIDNNALQDGFKLYHHTILFTKEGDWTIVQQGMDPVKKMARRYHWMSEGLKSFVEDPHKAICSDEKRKALNLVASESKELRKAMLELVREKPEKLIGEMEIILKLPKRHCITLEDIDLKRLKSVLLKAREVKSFEDLILVEGLGEKALRALALTAEVIFGTPISYRDPARFSFAHGGKDGHPYPVNVKLLKNTIEVLREAIEKAKMGNREKLEKLRRLTEWERKIG